MYHHLSVTAGDGEELEDAAITQTDYNRAMGRDVKHDPVYLSFLTRVQKSGCGDQVLRYCRWPLLLRSESVAAPNPLAGALLLSSRSDARERCRTEVKPCHRCGAPRCFEFQVEYISEDM
jgi:hypothetical protein